MCGRRFAGYGSGLGPWRSSGKHYGEHVRQRDYPHGFFRLETEDLSPRSQVVSAASVLLPVALGGLLVVLLVPGMFWLVFVFGWMIFPAFGLLMRGMAGISEANPKRVEKETGERELLGALREHGELSPARAAMETSLSVAEADGILGKLAEGGYLEVRVRGGGLYYALWEREARELEARR